MVKTLLSLLLCFLYIGVYGQHEDHNIPEKKAGPLGIRKGGIANDTTKNPFPQGMMHKMTHSFSRNLPMTRNGSGTTWHPDNTPMYMNMWDVKGWNMMLHYNVFGAFSFQNFNNEGRHEERSDNLNRRGGNEFNSSSWAMFMANKPMGKKGLLLVRGMFSLDPILEGGQGYPLLFQSGETWKDSPLVDRQHPHELISELALGYSYAISKHLDVFGYFGFPGEPALGPPAFMHRPSALNFPSSPISHHWQDATHISYGVGTLGARFRNIKLETSLFTGREPNENRYNFDKPRFDSYSVRFSFNPSQNTAVQASYGFLKSPEFHEPEIDINRVSISILNNVNLGATVLSSAFIWGMNNKIGPELGNNRNSNSVTLESYLQRKWMNYFTRLEYVQKSFHELDIKEEDESALQSVGSIGFGLSRYILKTAPLWVDLGGVGTISIIDKDLKSFYGNMPLSAEVFIRIIPSRKRNL